MFENAVQIITGKKQFTFEEIEAEIGSLKNAREQAAEKRTALEESLRKERVNLLAKKNNGNAIDTIKKQISRLDDEIEAMAQASVDLAEMLKAARVAKRRDRLNEIDTELSDLKIQRAELEIQLIKDYAKVAVSYHLLTGHSPLRINDPGQPFAPMEPGFKKVKSEINTLMNDVGMSIADVIRNLKHEADRIHKEASNECDALVCHEQ